MSMKRVREPGSGGRSAPATTFDACCLARFAPLALDRELQVDGDDHTEHEQLERQVGVGEEEWEVG